MALLIMGFEVDLGERVAVYAQANASGDASSLPSSEVSS